MLQLYCGGDHVNLVREKRQETLENKTGCSMMPGKYQQTC